jgi:hypothetical protein
MFEVGIVCVIALAIGYWGPFGWGPATTTYCMVTSFRLNHSSI